MAGSEGSARADHGAGIRSDLQSHGGISLSSPGNPSIQQAVRSRGAYGHHPQDGHEGFPTKSVFFHCLIYLYTTLRLDRVQGPDHTSGDTALVLE